MNRNQILDVLKERFQEIDILEAKEDVSPFIKDQQELDLWSKDFFIQTLDLLKTV
ncbi:MAG: hypothetical protein GY866_23730 [Proteobacteria bacterium]|nr:hypothetical protein [Pseudomonadota bacterium]